MKMRVTVIVLVIMVVVVLSAGSLTVFTPRFSESHKVLVMRSIGHELLRSSGDSTSRVMPVRKLDDNVYLIEFENNFSFSPDSLVKIAKQTLSKTEFPAQYAVHVMNCVDRNIVYGFEITGPEAFAPCVGRIQPAGCYAVQITFSEPIIPYNQSFLAMALGGIALIGLVIGFSRKQKEPRVVVEQPDTEKDFISIGQYKFYEEKDTLEHANGSVELSRKESTLLKLFAANANQLLMRDRLLKEVWEDEGVITGRSLDMFVSKLRKKLAFDPNVRLVSVHGKGYRLDIQN